jgi:hypothetical protein
MERPSVLPLHAITRERLRRGTLPLRTGCAVLAGPGCGHTCALCGQPITPHEVEYEIQAIGASHGLRFHFECESIWSQESQRLSEGEAQPLAMRRNG